MLEIRTVKSEKELKKLFNILSEIFYDDAVENKEHYYTMSERYEKMKLQFKNDKNFLMYIEDSNKIVAGLTGKNLDLKKKKITIGVLAVKKEYRMNGLATKLVNEFENRCKKKKIEHIDLGARFRACNLYKNLNYNYSLIVQVFDFVTIDDVRKLNKFNLDEIYSWQGETYGFIKFKVNCINKEIIDCFEKNIKTASAQYIFEKDIA